MMFSPVYRHVLIVRQAVLQQEVDYLLEVGASGAYGYIDNGMLTASKDRLRQFGLKPEDIVFRVSSTSGADASDAADPLPRGTGLRLEAEYPYEDLLRIDQLIGFDKPQKGAKLHAFGIRMSEYVR
ncbi:hypothetical protein [Paenibacillus protaetiae]|nr:hypothetical protein [Paenibacillus protaetiae]